MSEEKKLTQEDLMKARENAQKKVQANVVTGDIVTATPTPQTQEKK